VERGSAVGRMLARTVAFTGLACAVAVGVLVVAGPLAAAAASVSPGACGNVLLAGTDWLGGQGVDVKSNGADEGLGSDCSSALSYVNGHLAGEEWQCVEMINRLYLTRGWITSTWPGNAGPAFYDNAPGDLSRQPNGSVSDLGPGDVVIINVFDNGTAEGGHALVVNDSSGVTSGTVDLVSQNSGAPGAAEPQVSGTISGGSVSVGGGGDGWTYQTIGVVHAPASAPPPPPTVPVLSGYSGDRINSVTLSWSPSAGGQGGVTSYQVYRNGQLLSTVGGGTTSYTDASLPRGTGLAYQVQAVDSAGDASGLSSPLALDSVLPGQSGLAWISVDGHPSYCRRVGNSNGDPTAAVRCTSDTRPGWVTATSGGGTDWGYDAGRAWLNLNGNPAYCRRVGNNNGDPTAALRCTTYTGSKWVTVTSGGGTDWGYNVGWSWLSLNGHPSYCRRVGNNNGDPTAALRCTTYTGTKWVTVTSGGGTDWGYDTGWSWLNLNGNPAYCRRVGNNNGDPTAALRCTTYTGTRWVTVTSGGGTDWGYNVGWSWLSLNGHPSYCRRVGNNNGDPTAALRCTTYTGTRWVTVTSGGGTDWGYDTGQAWLSLNGHPSYCRRVGNNNGDPTAKVSCTTYTESKWVTSASNGGTDWGYND
jgi:hypothetical protein